ncbi:MAG: PIN domain nuclease [Gaiellaceae bacterium]
MARFLADTSAWNRSQATAEVDERWAALLEEGEMALCPPVELELLVSARGPADYEWLRDRLSAVPTLPLDDGAARLALRTQALLAARSHHRGPRPLDLLIAAVAEIHDVVLLHYDRHFDAIRRVTGQPMEWLARRGTLDRY